MPERGGDTAEIEPLPAGQRTPPGPPRPPAPPTTGYGASAGEPPRPRRRPDPRPRTSPVAFVHESSVELRKVAWPSNDALARATMVVLSAVVLATALVVAFDLGASAAFDRVFGR